MAGHGTNECGRKHNGGRRHGLKTQGRAKAVPPNIALKREAKKRETQAKRR